MITQADTAYAVRRSLDSQPVAGLWASEQDSFPGFRRAES